MRSPAWLRLGARLANWVRVNGKKAHVSRIDRARKVIHTVRQFQGEALSARTIGYLRRLDPFVFEEVVLTCLEESGAAVWRSSRYTGDGGVDGHVHLPQLGWAPIQVKRFCGHVCRSDVFDFYELLERRRCKAGLFVHSGKTSEDLRGVLRSTQVILFSGEKLAQLVRRSSTPWS
jgi:restriction system protein